MYAYIHTFIEKRESHTLSELQPTEPIHVRLFFAPVYMNKNDYNEYLNWAKEPMCTEFHSLGKVPPTVTKESLLPPNTTTVQVGQIKYDFVLEAMDDYLNYLEFVRHTLHLEQQRPVFRMKSQHIESKSSEDTMLDLRISMTSKIIECSEINEKLPSFLLVHPPIPTTHDIYDLWFKILKLFPDRAAFYRQEQQQEPQILFKAASYCWIACYSEEDVQTHMNEKQPTLYQLSTGQLIAENPHYIFWEKVLGTDAMSLVKIQKSLTLNGPFLVKKEGEKVLEMRLTNAQLAIVQPFMTNPDIRPFSLDALYNLFATPANSKPLEDPLRSGRLVGVNTVGAYLRSATASLPRANESFPPISTPKQKDSKDPEGMDAYACAWESVKTIPKKTPDIESLKSRLQTLLHEFKASVPSQPSTIQISPTLFQHGFLLFLLHKQYNTRSNVVCDYTELIECFKESMELQISFDASYTTILYPLLAENTRWLDTVTPEGITILEAQVLLSIYQYPVEYKNSQQSLLFQLITKQFVQTLKREGRVGAKALWEGYLVFLRKYKLDYVGFFGTQQDFNDIVKDAGYERKRMAQGKVWLNMQLP